MKAARSPVKSADDYADKPSWFDASINGNSAGLGINQMSALCALCRYRHKAHEQLHQGDKRDEAKAKSRRQRELEAEATAYVVMRHFGIDHVASNYLATYNIDGDQLKQSLETISATAKFLIAAIDPQLNQHHEAAPDTASEQPA